MFSDEAIALAIVTRKSASYQVAACREPDHIDALAADVPGALARTLGHSAERVRMRATMALARLGPHAEEEQTARTSTSRGKNR